MIKTTFRKATAIITSKQLAGARGAERLRLPCSCSYYMKSNNNKVRFRSSIATDTPTVHSAPTVVDFELSTIIYASPPLSSSSSSSSSPSPTPLVTPISAIESIVETEAEEEATPFLEQQPKRKKKAVTRNKKVKDESGTAMLMEEGSPGPKKPKQPRKTKSKITEEEGDTLVSSDNNTSVELATPAAATTASSPSPSLSRKTRARKTKTSSRLLEEGNLNASVSTAEPSDKQKKTTLSATQTNKTASKKQASIPLSAVAATSLLPSEPILRRRRTKKRLDERDYFPTSLVLSGLQTIDTSLPMTYQSYASISNGTESPELEPAPFPRDIHSSMPYINRDVQQCRAQNRNDQENRSGGSGSHNDLTSFEGLNHNTGSTIYRGTLFEYQTQEVLRKYLGIYTQRSAGNNDLGVDLRGTWFLPLSASPEPGDLVRHLKVIVQCKMVSSKVGPKFVRELQGTLSYETQPTMAILAVSTDFTRQALLPYAKSLWPMGLVVIDTEKMECLKLMWNRAAEKVMHGVQVGTRWVANDSKGQGENEWVSRPVLCFEGKVIKRLPGPYLNMGKQKDNNEACKDDTQEAGDARIEIQDQNRDEDERDMTKKAPAMAISKVPDRNTSTEPEYLYRAPDASSGWRSVEDEGDDETHTAPHCDYMDMLSWSKPLYKDIILSSTSPSPSKVSHK
ncbi:hypothetical protein BX616_005569 [Lobosporangium transversale]|uniref:Restriction endonuclease type IV Mrr domain-containing protein n=1 Tax=Lobosporangium transversale TaxID=64571 RepID=A0A1Y2H2A0_9FUNG|nr:hypothetical protein BCR41DRAFT_417840 [Lobosporangium transversale]KAF9897453.1 hypothetical protein BX616_005569 [Lobosporangium transversale]ORZ28699.1 hypothetical protein BCR41DRAFT_417840 [Lobosporangium transversale]|eukprot:XP_021886372.1 hypothetical protein BCR41DRAFT_417840 [Lobosporangium transversale]